MMVLPATRHALIQQQRVLVTVQIVGDLLEESNQLYIRQHRKAEIDSNDNYDTVEPNAVGGVDHPFSGRMSRLVTNFQGELSA